MLTYLLLALNTLVDMKLGALTMLNLSSCCWKLTFIMHSETTSLQLSVLVFADRGLQGPWYRQGPEGTNGLSCPPNPAMARDPPRAVNPCPSHDTAELASSFPQPCPTVGPAKLGPHPGLALVHAHPHGGARCLGLGLLLVPPRPALIPQGRAPQPGLGRRGASYTYV